MLYYISVGFSAQNFECATVENGLKYLKGRTVFIDVRTVIYSWIARK
jgi:hypothetical protein